MRLIVIGAGSSGLGVALAAARRGWAVEILEARDIGGGTTTTSTKLIHGGVRYLEAAFKRLSYADWRLVREALRERAWMLQSHPRLCHPLSIILPVRHPLEKWYYGFGLWLYDKLSYPHNITKTAWVGAKELSDRFPRLLPGYKGGWRYWDGQFVDRLYAVHLALFLRQRYGVVIRTHAKVVSVAPRGKEVVVEAALRNGERYETKGDYVVNATGPWADEIRNLVQIGVKPRLRLSRGSHLVFSKAHLPIEEGFLIPRTKDGRLLFVLPWIEGTVLVGTTDEEVKAPTWPAAVSEAETQFLIEHVKRYFGVNELEIGARFAGYRPLVAQRPNATAKLARTHVVEVWPSQRVISLMGGKWTTFRQMGEDAIAAIARLSGRNLAPGEPVLSVEPDLSELKRYQQGDAQPIVPGLPYTWGEVAFWQSLGWAQDPEDLVAGRWLLPFYDEQKAKQVREALQSKWHKLD